MSNKMLYLLNSFVKYFRYNHRERQVDTINKIKPVICSVLIIFLLSGCGSGVKKPDNDGEQADTGGIVVDPIPQPKEYEITLYFKHQYADYLVPEKRKVLLEDQTIEQLVVEELLKGPQNFERRAVMPPGTKLIDVTRMEDTVFVNLTKEFLGDVLLTDLPDKANVPLENRKQVLGEMKRLSIYSIVNSLTYLDGVKQVQIYVDNIQKSYKDLGAELLLGSNVSLDANLPMGRLTRDKTLNLTPSKSVKYLFDQLKGEPDWNIVYSFLSSKRSNGDVLPPADEFKASMQDVEGNIIEYEGTPVIDEEITTDVAFVNVKYTVKWPERNEVQEVLKADNELEGIWKVRMPKFLEDIYR